MRRGRILHHLCELSIIKVFLVQVKVSYETNCPIQPLVLMQPCWWGSHCIQWWRGLGGLQKKAEHERKTRIAVGILHWKNNRHRLKKPHCGVCGFPLGKGTISLVALGMLLDTTLSSASTASSTTKHRTGLP